MKLTMRKQGNRVSFHSWLLGWVAFSIRVRPMLAQDSEYNTRADICSDGLTLGYDTLEELNLDILDERKRIEEGGEPYNPYLFTLCPQTVFDAEGNTIVPSLNNILLGCGAPPVSTNQCILLNGDVQVAIGDFLDTEIPVETVRLSGMTFSSFTGSAIAGGATFGTRVELFDTIFENFQSSFVILQQTADDNPVAPFEVQLRSTIVKDGTAGTFFANDGGVLRIVDMTVTNVNAAGAFVSTEGAQAATFLAEVDVSSSDINEIFTALNGADLDASEVKVSGMTAFRRIFSVSGSVADPPETSRLDLRESEFSGNSATADGSQWIAVDARNSAIVTVTNTTVSDNSGAEHLFSVSQSSTMSLQKVDITNAVGALPISENVVSTLGFANTNSEITWTDSTWTNVNEFTAGLFAVFESNINAQRICIDGTKVDAVVFISDDSTSSEADNFIENLESEACPEEGLRLAKENAGGGCFDPESSSPCRPDCQPFATAESCATVAQVSPTATPGSSTSQVDDTAAPTGAENTALPTAPDENTVPPGSTAPPSGLLRGSDQPSSVPTDGSQPPETSIPPTASPTTSVTTVPTPLLSDGGNETSRPSDMPSQLPTIVGTTNGTSAPTSFSPSTFLTGEPTGSESNATVFPTAADTAPTTSPAPNGGSEPPRSPTGSPFPTSTPRDAPTGSSGPQTSGSQMPSAQGGQGTVVPESGSPSYSPIAAPAAETSPPSAIQSPQPSYLATQTPSQTPSQTPTWGPSVVPISFPSTMPSIYPSARVSSERPSISPTEATDLPSLTPSVYPTVTPTPKPTKCRERPTVIAKGKGTYESSESSSSKSGKSSKHHKSKKHDKHHHHKSKKSKKKRNLQNGLKHHLYEKEGRHNNLLPSKQGKLHDRLLKKSHSDKGKGKGHEHDDDHVHTVIIIQQPPPDDEYWDLPYCD